MHHLSVRLKSISSDVLTVQEDHGQPIFGAQFNYFSGVGEELLLATVGGNRVCLMPFIFQHCN